MIEQEIATEIVTKELEAEHIYSIEDIESISKEILMTRSESMPKTNRWKIDKDQYRKDGPISEALFWISCNDLNIPITISKGKEDLQGIDFYIFKEQIPVDVTTNTLAISRKMESHGFPILLLPTTIGFNRIREFIKRKRFNPYEYLKIVDLQIIQNLEEREGLINKGINPIYFNNLERIEKKLSQAITI